MAIIIRIFKKIFDYSQWLFKQNKKRVLIEIFRHIFPSIQRQYKLDRMVGPVGYWSELQAYQIGTLKKLGLQPHHKLLDIGCGPLQGGIAFINYLNAGNYCGIDIKENSIVEAKRLINKIGLISKKPFLSVSNSFGKDELSKKKFDYIWCSQMLYHLDECLINELFQQISEFLTSQGKFIGDIIGFPNNVKEDSYWDNFSFYKHEVEVLKKMANKYELSLRKLGQIITFGYPAKLDLHTNELLEITRK
ncbi:MAG: methyltransferase [Spirochaetes bacterium]|nr:methyltransferase [Spirochaetota bacterium]